MEILHIFSYFSARHACLDFLNLFKGKTAKKNSGKSSLDTTRGFKTVWKCNEGKWQKTQTRMCEKPEDVEKNKKKKTFSYLFDCIIFQYSNVIVMCLIIMFSRLGFVEHDSTFAQPNSLKYVIIISFGTCTRASVRRIIDKNRT
jgi:hypothetical protein